MKIKNKNLIILGIVFFVMLLLTGNVNATEINAEDIEVSATIEDLGLGGTTDNFSRFDDWNEDDKYVVTQFNITDVQQEKLNEFAKEAKETTVNINLSVPSNTTKVLFEGEEVEINENDGKKQVSFENTIGYTNTSAETPYKEDIGIISFQGSYLPEENHELEKIELYFDDETTTVLELYCRIDISSENAYFSYNECIGDKYGLIYCMSGEGGRGGLLYEYSPEDKTYLVTEDDVNDTNSIYVAELPKDVKSEDVYYEFIVSEYQGEKIEIENRGTLYYSGSDRYWYYYRNTLNNLTNMDKILPVKLKTTTGYELIRTADVIANVDETRTREDMLEWHGINTYTDITKEVEVWEQNINNITVNGKGSGGAYFEALLYEEKDVIYKKLENKLSATVAEKYNVIDMKIFEMSGYGYYGPLKLTFDVGTENNGKSYLIGHLVKGLEYEEFTGTVENGKITITVDSLSPFMVSILEEKAGANTNGGTGTIEKEEEKTEVKTETKEEDKTKAPGVLPDTGLEITIVLAIAVMLVAVTVVYNKYRGLKDI